MKCLRFLLAGSMLFVLLHRGDKASACGPFFTPFLLSLTQRPDPPFEKFARGELGVLQPTYLRIYLAPAYRQLMGTGFDAAETKTLMGVWEGGRNSASGPPREEAFAFWAGRAREAVGLPSVQGRPEQYRRFAGKGLYGEYLNCPQDAYRTAAQTLGERAKKFGSTSPKVKAWLDAQDQVFVNCERGRVIPAQIVSDDALVVADRNYQIAAAHFYSEDFDEARTRFDAIAQDKFSPWSKLAPYLAARALVRKGTLGAEERKFLAAPLQEAEQRLDAILADPRQSAIHPASVRLRSLVRFRLYPEEHLKDLETALLQKGAAIAIDSGLMDYTTLLVRHRPDHPGDMTDWVLTVRASSSESTEHAVAQWEKQSSEAWLVAALMKISPAHPQRAVLASAAAKLRADSPAFVTVTYHRLRLEVEAGEAERARKELDGFLAKNQAALTVSPRNLFLDLRLRVARDLSEFARFAQREIAGGGGFGDDIEWPAPRLDGGNGLDGAKRFTLGKFAAEAINRHLPLSSLVRVAADQGFAPDIRDDLAQAAYTRAVILERPEVARQIQPDLLRRFPELKGLISAVDSASGPQERRFAQILLLLRSPGLRPYVSSAFWRAAPIGELDSLRENWWCAPRSDVGLDIPICFGQHGAGEVETTADKTVSEKSPVAFLSPEERKAARGEWEQLVSVGTAPDYLAKQVLSWARKHPDDPRVPEALHRVVRATRLGCADAETTKHSKAAFQFLHRRYPKSEWAKRTKYWY